jgi:hypothetical protein
MALIINGTNITRVSVNSVFVKTVVQNDTTVFNLSDWSYDGTSGTFTHSAGTYTYGFYSSPLQVPVGQLSSYLNTNFPVQNYGAGSRIQVEVFAYVLDPNTFEYVYMFIRYEYYITTQTAGAPVYYWAFIESYSTEPSQADFLYEGPASDVGNMADELQSLYPANDYQGYYAAYYSTSTSLYYLFYSTT